MLPVNIRAILNLNGNSLHPENRARAFSMILKSHSQQWSYWGKATNLAPMINVFTLNWTNPIPMGCTSGWK